MNKKDKKYVCDCVNNEGFDYAFIDYSNFPEIKDKKFHELRQAYIEARNNLANYIDLENNIE